MDGQGSMPGNASASNDLKMQEKALAAEAIEHMQSDRLYQQQPISMGKYP